MLRFFYLYSQPSHLSVDVKMPSEEPQRADQSIIFGADFSDKSKSTLLSQVHCL